MKESFEGKRERKSKNRSHLEYIYERGEGMCLVLSVSKEKKKNHKTPNWIRSKWKDFSFDEAKFKRGFRL